MQINAFRAPSVLSSTTPRVTYSLQSNPPAVQFAGRPTVNPVTAFGLAIVGIVFGGMAVLANKTLTEAPARRAALERAVGPNPPYFSMRAYDYDRQYPNERIPVPNLLIACPNNVLPNFKWYNVTRLTPTELDRFLHNRSYREELIDEDKVDEFDRRNVMGIEPMGNGYGVIMQDDSEN